MPGDRFAAGPPPFFAKTAIPAARTAHPRTSATTAGHLFRQMLDVLCQWVPDRRIEVTADAVHMSVTDDGRGLPQPLVEGVGIAAIRERAAELGGTVELTSHGGTTVTTVVPLRASEAR